MRRKRDRGPRPRPPPAPRPPRTPPRNALARRHGPGTQGAVRHPFPFRRAAHRGRCNDATRNGLALARCRLAPAAGGGVGVGGISQVWEAAPPPRASEPAVAPPSPLPGGRKGGRARRTAAQAARQLLLGSPSKIGGEGGDAGQQTGTKRKRAATSAALVDPRQRSSRPSCLKTLPMAGDEYLRDVGGPASGLASHGVALHVIRRIDEFMGEVGLEVSRFPSEKKPLRAPAPAFGCEWCGRSFPKAMSL